MGLPTGTVEGGLIPSWNDQIFQASFENRNPAWQPVWRSSDIDFNGLPVVHFNAIGKGLLARNLAGPVLGTSQTVAVVYQYITQTGGLYSHNTIMGNQESWTLGSGARWTYQTLNHNSPHTNNLGVGYWLGSSSFVNGSTAIFDLLPRILVLSGNALIKDGVSFSKTVNGIIGFTANMLGAGESGNSIFGGAFKIAEIVVWNENYSVSDCLEISAELNAKYGIY